MKKMLALMLILILSLTLCACGGTVKPTAPVPETQAPQNQTPQTQAPQTQAPQTQAPDTKNEPDDIGDPSRFVGSWKYDDKELYLMIDAMGTWAYYKDDPESLYSYGTFVVDNNVMMMIDSDGEWINNIYPDLEGKLRDSNGDFMSPYNEDESPFIGAWAREQKGLILMIRNDGTWTYYEGSLDSFYSEGTYYMENGVLVMMDSSGDLVDTLSFGSDGQLTDARGNSLTPYDP